MLARTFTHRSLATALCSAVLVTAALAPAATAMPQDLRSPDTRDQAETSSLAGTTSPTPQDLRAPDTRDAASGYAPVMETTPPPVESSSSGGFDWASAAIGVAAVGGALLIVVALMGSHRPHVRRHAAGA